MANRHGCKVHKQYLYMSSRYYFSKSAMSILPQLRLARFGMSSSCSEAPHLYNFRQNTRNLLRVHRFCPDSRMSSRPPWSVLPASLSRTFCRVVRLYLPLLLVRLLDLRDTSADTVKTIELLHSEYVEPRKEAHERGGRF